MPEKQLVVVAPYWLRAVVRAELVLVLDALAVFPVGTTVEQAAIRLIA